MVCRISNGAEGRTRTGTEDNFQRILSPLRLPNSATPAGLSFDSVM